MDVLRIIPNTWTSLQTFTNGIKVSGGLTVPTGQTVSFPANSIPSTCISGLPSSGSSSGVALFSTSKPVDTGYNNYNNSVANVVGFQYYCDVQYSTNVSETPQINPKIPLTIRSVDVITITTLDCGATFGALIGSVWMVQMTVYYYGHTASDRNWFQFRATDTRGNGYLSSSHYIDASTSIIISTDTFMVYFNKITKLQHTHIIILEPWPYYSLASPKK